MASSQPPKHQSYQKLPRRDVQTDTPRKDVWKCRAKIGDNYPFNCKKNTLCSIWPFLRPLNKWGLACFHWCFWPFFLGCSVSHLIFRLADFFCLPTNTPPPPASKKNVEFGVCFSGNTAVFGIKNLKKNTKNIHCKTATFHNFQSTSDYRLQSLAMWRPLVVHFIIILFPHTPLLSHKASYRL